MNTLEFYLQMETLSGTNDKIQLLEEMFKKNNDTFTTFIKLIYDPKYNFYMKLTKKDVDLEVCDDHDYDEYTIERFNGILIDIFMNSKRGKDVKQYMIEFIELHGDNKLRELLFHAVNRNLKVGIQVKSINKAYKNVYGEDLIEEVPYMRCSLKDKSNWDKLQWEEGVIVQLKADGMFCNAYYEDGHWLFRSRNGSSFPLGSFEGIESDLDKSSFSSDKVISGELIIYEDGVLMERSKGNGLLNSLLQNGVLEDKYKVVFEVWDLYKRDFKKDKSTYLDRWNELVENLTDGDSVRLIDSHTVYSPEDSMRITNEWMAQGYEGSIVKNPKAKFKNGTSKDFIKYKVDLDVDLRITGWNEGNGKNEDTFGSLTCESEDGKVVVNVSGFTDKERQEIFDEIDYYIGKVMTVRSNGIINRDGSDIKSLFLPRFIEFRLDKDIADTLEDIETQFNNILNGK